MSQTGLENRVQIRAVIDHAVRANVAIYAADARGLQALVPGGEAQMASVRGNQAFTGQSMSNQYDRMAGSQDTLTTLSRIPGAARSSTATIWAACSSGSSMTRRFTTCSATAVRTR